MFEASSVRPIPVNKGLGFFSTKPLPFMIEHGYRYEKAGYFHNYHFTNEAFAWPFPFKDDRIPKKVDGFSPNLNKQLHVGHLRNLALANALSKLLPTWQFVSLLGASQGVYQTATVNLKEWFNFLDYRPALYYDVLMPLDAVKRQPGTGKNEGSMVWLDKRDREHVVIRSNLIDYNCNLCHKQIYIKETDPIPLCHGFMNRGKSTIVGKPNYVYCDLAFAETVSPDYYLTGAEQVEHFRNIGFAYKHLPMGLVLGKDGKKLKSRTGDAFSAEDTVQAILEQLKPTPESRKLAWNIIAWNFLHSARMQDVRFDPVSWTSPESPGLYIAYTYARLKSALKDADCVIPEKPIDWKLDAYCEYFEYYYARATETMDAGAIANYLHDLSGIANEAYTLERIADGRPAFRSAIAKTIKILEKAMQLIGMFPLDKV